METNVAHMLEYQGETTEGFHQFVCPECKGLILMRWDPYKEIELTTLDRSVDHLTSHEQFTVMGYPILLVPHTGHDALKYETMDEFDALPADIVQQIENVLARSGSRNENERNNSDEET